MSSENSNSFVQEESKGATIPEITVQFKKTKVYGKVTSSREVAALLRKLYAEGSIQVQEQFIALFLNNAGEVIGYYRHSVGGIAMTIVEIKLLLAAALKSLSKSIILSHNHPSGSTKVSLQDEDITKKVKEAAKLFDIQVLDHIILTENSYVSFSDEGLAGPYNFEDSAPALVNERGSKALYSDDARNMAKYAIQKFVLRGEDIKKLKTLNREFNYGKHKVRLSDGKLFVKHSDSRVNYEFPLQSIYNEVLDELDDPDRIEDEPEKPSVKAKKNTKPKSEAIRVNTKDAQEVERIEEEVKFIKRYVLLHGKEKTDLQLLSVLSALQKAILEKRIRKTSSFRKQIEFIQNDLVARINRLDKIRKPEDRKEVVKIAPAMLKSLAGIAGSEKVRLSVNYLKRYIGMQGKNLTKEKAVRLMSLLENAAKSKKIRAADPYARKIETIHKSLWEFVNKAKPKDTLTIHDAVLNGLNGILECACDEKKVCTTEVEQPETEERSNTVMNSLDFAKLKFKTLGFTGKWLKLVGDPCAGFSAMVFGKPKMGKSYLCMEWAGYLAKHHGDTLYVAKEEKLDGTLQKKLLDKDVKHRSLFVSDHLPDDLSPYEYIFLDSVNKLGLKPQDLDNLKAQNPGKNFIDIHQTTKDGKFRGTNEYQHDVDIVIEVPERGKAVQFGRFNQGGEISIFEQQEPLCEEDDHLMAA